MTGKKGGDEKKKGGSLESKLGNSEEAHIHTESTGRKRYILMYMPILNGVLVVFFFLCSLSFAIKASHGSCIRWNCSWSTTAWSVVLLLDKENSTLCRWGGRVSSSQNNVGRNNLATPYLLQRHADTHTHTHKHTRKRCVNNVWQGLGTCVNVSSLSVRSLIVFACWLLYVF